MTLYNICTKKTYKKDGEEKVIWLNCGTLRQTDEGKLFIQMNNLPDVTYYVFEQVKKEEKAADF